MKKMNTIFVSVIMALVVVMLAIPAFAGSVDCDCNCGCADCNCGERIGELENELSKSSAAEKSQASIIMDLREEKSALEAELTKLQNAYDLLLKRSHFIGIVEREGTLYGDFDYWRENVLEKFADGTYAVRGTRNGTRTVLEDLHELCMEHNYFDNVMELPYVVRNGKTLLAVYLEGKIYLVDFGNPYNGALSIVEEVKTGLPLQELEKYGGAWYDWAGVLKLVAVCSENKEAEFGWDPYVRVTNEKKPAPQPKPQNPAPVAPVVPVTPVVPATPVTPAPSNDVEAKIFEITKYVPYEVVKEIPVEVIKEVPVEKIVEVVKEVPVEVIREIQVEVIKEVPVEKIVEIVREVPVEVIKEITVEVIKEVPVEKIVEVVKEVPVEVIKEVPVEKIVEVVKEVPVEVIKEVPVYVYVTPENNNNEPENSNPSTSDNEEPQEGIVEPEDVTDDWKEVFEEQSGDEYSDYVRGWDEAPNEGIVDDEDITDDWKEIFEEQSSEEYSDFERGWDETSSESTSDDSDASTVPENSEPSKGTNSDSVTPENAPPIDNETETSSESVDDEDGFVPTVVGIF